MSIAIADLVGSLSLNLVADNNGNVGIGTKSPLEKLDVNGNGNIGGSFNVGSHLDVVGNISASGSVSGEGSGLTSLNATNISSGTLNNARLPANISVTSLTGNGSGLTSLNATNISSGTLNNARLPSAISVTSISASGFVSGEGSGLTSLNATNISSGTLNNARLPSAISVTSLTGNGSGLTALHATNISSGTLNNARLPSIINTNTLIGTQVGIGTNTPLSKLSITPHNVESKITLWDGDSTTNHFGFGVSGNQLNYHVSASGDRHVFYSGGKNGNGTELMRIQGNGRVGIGTNAPLEKLDVNGNVNITGIINVNGNITGNINGLFYAPGFIVQAISENVHDIVTYGGVYPPVATEITPLNVVITPKFVGSKIQLEWMINFESYSETVFLIYRKIGTGSVTKIGYNNTIADNVWVGVASTTRYWVGVSKEPDNIYLTWTDSPNTLEEVTYYVYYQSSYTGAALPFYLNRTYNGGLEGLSQHERTVSSKSAMEIAQ